MAGKQAVQYTVKRTDNARGAGYAHLDIELLHTYTSSRDGIPTFYTNGGGNTRITWQATLNEVDRSWYAYNLETSVHDPETLITFARLVGKLARDGQAPKDILANLAKMGATHVVYDNRLGGYVARENVPASDIHNWYAPKLANTLAHNEDEARQQIAAALVKRGELDNLSTWLASGAQVEPSYYHGSDYPDMRTIEELITVA